jgi:hypothetical protein
VRLLVVLRREICLQQADFAEWPIYGMSAAKDRANRSRRTDIRLGPNRVEEPGASAANVYRRNNAQRAFRY